MSFFKYNYKVEKCKEKGPFLILGNHSMAHDPLLYSNIFKENIYYLTTDELFRMGTFSKLVKFLLAPIPKTKSLRDTSYIKSMLKISKEQKNICIFPEGATTYSGEMSKIDPAIAKLAKKINYRIAFVNLEGGFQSYPKFAVHSRKGRVTAKVVKILSIDEVQNMSNEELYDEINKNLKVDLLTNVKFKYSRKAEYLENTLYYCNDCNSFDTTTSYKNEFYCTKCAASYTVDEYLNLHKNDGKEYKISDLYHLQENKINSLTLDDIHNLDWNAPISLIEVVNFVKEPRARGDLKLIDGSLVINDLSFPLKDITAACTTDSHICDFYINDKTYQIKGDRRFPALKYMNLIYRYKNLLNDEESKFLGI